MQGSCDRILQGSYVRIIKDPVTGLWRILATIFTGSCTYPRIFWDPCTCILAGSCRILATIPTASCTIPGPSRILATVLTGSCRISGSSRILVHVCLQDPAESQDPQGFLQLSLQHPAQSQDLLGSLHMYPCRILKDPCNYSYRILQNPRISKDPCTCILVGSSRILATILTASCTIPGSSRILAHVSLQDPQGSLQLFLQDPAEFQDLLGSLYMFAYRILQNPRILEGPCDYLLGSYRNLESLENIFEDCGKLPHR